MEKTKAYLARAEELKKAEQATQPPQARPKFPPLPQKQPHPQPQQRQQQKPESAAAASASLKQAPPPRKPARRQSAVEHAREEYYRAIIEQARDAPNIARRCLHERTRFVDDIFRACTTEAIYRPPAAATPPPPDAPHDAAEWSQRLLAHAPPRAVELVGMARHWTRAGQWKSHPRLFCDTQDPQDVVQGALGDCWLLFVASAVVLLLLSSHHFHHQQASQQRRDVDGGRRAGCTQGVLHVLQRGRGRLCRQAVPQQNAL